jgi:hypothetical protein
MEGEAGRTGCRLYPAGMREGVPTTFKVPRLSDPPGRDKVVVYESAKDELGADFILSHLPRSLACAMVKV